MVSTKILYMVQDERELPYLYNMQDSAVCIAGKEIRLMFPGGMKVFVEKQAMNPTQQTFNSIRPQSNLEEIVKQQGEQLAALSQKLDNLVKKEESSNDQSKTNGTRNAF